jgi:hypothetical protein
MHGMDEWMRMHASIHACMHFVLYEDYGSTVLYTVYEYYMTFHASIHVHACMNGCMEWMNGCACMHSIRIFYNSIRTFVQNACMHAWMHGMDEWMRMHPFMHACILYEYSMTFHASIHVCMHAQYTNILQQYTNLRTKCMHACMNVLHFWSSDKVIYYVPFMVPCCADPRDLRRCFLLCSSRTAAAATDATSSPSSSSRRHGSSSQQMMGMGRGAAGIMNAWNGWMDAHASIHACIVFLYIN